MNMNGDESAKTRIPQTYRARLSERQVFNDTFHLLHFEMTAPPRIEFEAGQYVLLTVPGTPQKKSYSIASPPQTEHAIELLVDVRPQGHGTSYLGGMEPGHEIEFMAPIGQFLVEPRSSEVGQNEHELVFVATGSGIAPFKAMIEDLLVYQGDDRPITLVWGLRHVEDQFWYDDFGLLAEQHANFEFHPVLSQPPEDWPLSQGRVTDVLLAYEFPQLGSTGFYLCGGSSMIEDAKHVLQQRGVVEAHIHHEKFF